MASEKFSFHIRNAHPGDMAAILATLGAHPGLEKVSLVEKAEALGFVIRDRQHLDALITARDLGLVEKEKNIVTTDGHLLTQLELNKPKLFADIIHGLQYILWNQDCPAANCFSWSYRTLCQIIWESGTIVIKSRQDLASKVERLAQGVFDRPDISFSQKSIGGALLWLIELSPSILEKSDMRLTRRTFCPPELFVLAVDFAYRTHGADYGVNLLLSEDHRNTICQVCLLEPNSFDRVLQYATAQFDYLESGMGGGWGQYLTLRRSPTLEDFI